MTTFLMKSFCSPAKQLVHKPLSGCFRRLFTTSFIFDKDTHIEPSPVCERGAVISESLAHKYEFRSVVTNQWSIGDAPNGGYLASIMANAALKVSPFKDPLTLTTHYVSKAVEDTEATITVVVLNKAKTSITLQITLSQADRTRCVMIGAFGKLKDSGISHKIEQNRGPDLPHFSGCLDATKLLIKHTGDHLRIAQRVQFYVPKSRPFFQINSKDAVPVLEGWIKFSDNRPADMLSSLFFLDSLPPPVLNILWSKWLPTLEYTVHFWAPPLPATMSLENQSTASNQDRNIDSKTTRYTDNENSMLRFRFSSNHIENSTFHTDGELWSSDGKKLLAKSRQLARII